MKEKVRTFELLEAVEVNRLEVEHVAQLLRDLLLGCLSDRLPVLPLFLLRLIRLQSDRGACGKNSGWLTTYQSSIAKRKREKGWYP